MTLPWYAEAPSKTTAHEVGAGCTTSVRHMSRLAPQPCGMPYATPSTEFHGLCVMMSLVNNWDVSTINNGIVDTGLERRYLVTDMGASFGNAGDSVSESKSNPADYARSTFIEAATPDFVDFALHSRLFMQAAVTRPYYRQISLANGASKHILRADARWLGHRLSLLSVHQIRDAFRAAGYKPDEIDLYTRVVQSRIAALLAL